MVAPSPQPEGAANPAVGAGPPQAPYVYAPGDVYPVTERERELCARASQPDWVYLGGLLVLDAGAIWYGSNVDVKYSSSVPVRMAGPALIGVTWGATVGGAWVGESPREGDVRESWPLAVSFALLAGATAPFVNGIAVGNLPITWSTPEREMRVVTAALAGVGGALLPYVLPPRTLSAARAIDRMRFGFDARGGAFVGYRASF